MCGLTGWVGQSVSKDQRLRRARALEGLMVANGERGTDAAGVGIIHSSGRQSVYKRAVSSYRIVDNEELQRLVRSHDAIMAIGHTRWGTMGKNIDRNAHPFSENHVLGAHNGVIWNHKELEDAIGPVYKPLQVDSQVSFRLLSEVDPDPEKITQVLPMMRGQLALTWYDERDEGALWMFRHSNPISMAVVPNVGAFWSSEYAHLAIVMQAVYGSNWEHHVIKEDVLYRITWDGGIKYETWPVEMPKYSTAVVNRGPAWTPPPVTQGAGATVVAKPLSKREKRRKRREAQRANSPLAIYVDSSVPTPVQSTLNDDSNDLCDVCKGKIDYRDDDATFINQGEGYMVCGPCDRWWWKTGADMYDGDIDEAVQLMEANGSYHELRNRGSEDFAEIGHMRFGG